MKIYSYIVTAVLIQCSVMSNAQNSCSNQLDTVAAYIKDSNHLFANSQQRVPLEEAVLKTYLYNLWCEAIPDKIVSHEYDSNAKTITFQYEERTLIGKSAELANLFLTEFYEYAKKNGKVPDTLNFSYNTEARSYFISKHDLKNLFTDSAYQHTVDSIKRQQGTVNVEEGVRVYVGARNIDPENAMVTASHIYVVPQIKYSNQNSLDVHYYDDFYINEKDPVVLDLTTPCPNACGVNSSKLNWSRCD